MMNINNVSIIPIFIQYICMSNYVFLLVRLKIKIKIKRKENNDNVSLSRITNFATCNLALDRSRSVKM